MNGLVIALIIIGVLLLVLLIFLFFLSMVPTHPGKISYADGWKNEMEKPFMQGKDMTPTSVYTIKSFDGYELSTSFLPAYSNIEKYGGVVSEYDYTKPFEYTSEGPNVAKEYEDKGIYNCNGEKFVIISHGYTYNRYGMLKYASIFRRYGYNCIMYDNRGHGCNAKSIVYFGVKESRDLISVINDTKKRFGKDIKLGLMGESLGASLTIMSLKYKPDVDFVVSDCGYANLVSALKTIMQNYVKYIPMIVLDIASAFSKITNGYNFLDVNPVDCIGDSKVPICFMHGSNDNVINCVNSKKMHAACTGYSEYNEFEGAGHGASIDTDYEKYEKLLVEFLNKVYQD